MAANRKLIFLNESYYHVFNRGIDRRVTFTNKREHDRAIELLSFYQYATIPLRYSHFSLLPEDKKEEYLSTMISSGKIVDVIAYSLMPNHFHLLLKQKKEKGIATYLANFMNAYTKYFNTKHARTGSLFQGIFKAIYVETDEQLIHLTCYIHLNPVASSLISPAQLTTYMWSSYPAYIGIDTDNLVSRDAIQSIKALVNSYEDFVKDQIAYAKELEKIKHMTFE
ncbi:MAG: transposase [Patescibacteria group bacterium]